MLMNDGTKMDRPRALMLAAARRECWRIMHRRSTKALLEEYKTKQYQMRDEIKQYRPPNVQRVDLMDARMIRTELRRRGQDPERFAPGNKVEYRTLSGAIVKGVVVAAADTKTFRKGSQWVQWRVTSRGNPIYPQNMQEITETPNPWFRQRG